MAVFVRHEPCPSCGSKDNLGRYDDGSAWCFGCHYRERANRIPVTAGNTLEVDNVIQLDDDLCFDYPGHVVAWLAKYGITVQEGIKHGWKYSPKRDQLVFLFYDKKGKLSFTQARNFREGTKKYFNQGSPAELLPILYSGVDTGQLVIVEDVVSASKIARQCDAMPCLGSYLSKQKLSLLRGFYDVLMVWLDADKLKEAREMAEWAKWLGFQTKVVFTELDPKEYSNEEIREKVEKPMAQ